MNHSITRTSKSHKSFVKVAQVTSAIHIPSFSKSFDALCEKQTEFKWLFTDHLLQ